MSVVLRVTKIESLPSLQAKLGTLRALAEAGLPNALKTTTLVWTEGAVLGAEHPFEINVTGGERLSPEALRLVGTTPSQHGFPLPCVLAVGTQEITLELCPETAADILTDKPAQAILQSA